MEGISSDKQSSSPPVPSPLKNIILVASLAAGIQFGWALQLSLLTPYVQLLGIPHKWASIIWLCGPISGMFVQPLTGYYSDNCNSKFGRRRPFIAAGSACVLIAVILIGYAADLGKLFGDDVTQTPKKRAIAIFVVGFWILDVANNMLQGPCRAFLADLCGHNQKKTRSANAFYSFFMAVGNVLGYAAGAWTHLYRIFPFTHTAACDVYCANLKSCFFLSIALLLIVTVLALSLVPEKTLSAGNEEDDKEEASPPMGAFIGEIFDALKGLERPMWVLLLVTCLNWIAWFPFTLFDTDWMGREVYGGDVGSDAAKSKMYDLGVRMGSFGLMLNSVVLGLMSLGVEYLGRRMGGAKRLWGAVNFLLAICLAMMVLITKVAESNRRYLIVDGKQQLQQPPMGVTVAALAVFSVLGIPLAVTYSIPFALASIFTNASNSGAGQGLSLGVMNIAIVVPQMIVSVAAGPFDALFGGGNLPAFVVGAISAAASAVLAFTLLPSPPSDAHAAPKNVDVFP